MWGFARAQSRIRYALAVVLVVLLTCSAFDVQAAEENLAAQWLASQQNLDGSWGVDETIKPLYTANAVLALASISQRNTAYANGIAWLENHHVPNVDYLARQILALASRGNNVEPDLQSLRVAPDLPPAGNNGWGGVTAGYAGSPVDTALVLQAFALVGEMTNIQPVLNYLRATQLTGATKGWAVSHEAANDPSTTSDPCFDGSSCSSACAICRK